MHIPYKVVAERHDGVWQSTEKHADKTDSVSTLQSTEGTELETDEHIEYGGDIEFDSVGQHKSEEMQLHTDDFADQQQSNTPPQKILDSSSSSNAPAQTVDTVIPDQSSQLVKDPSVEKVRLELQTMTHHCMPGDALIYPPSTGCSAQHVNQVMSLYFRSL